MKREIFTFDSKDYEKFATVNFSFAVTDTNLQTFLETTKLFKARTKTSLGYSMSKMQNGIISNRIRNYKMVYVKLYAQHLAEVLETLGVNVCSQVYSPLSVFRNSFDKNRNLRGILPKYKYISFNPKKRKKWSMINNTPLVITGNQVVFCGTLYRRYEN